MSDTTGDGDTLLHGTVITDERGPYVIEMACNADVRGRQAWAQYWANSLIAMPGEAVAAVGNTTIRFMPNQEGEPRP